MIGPHVHMGPIKKNIFKIDNIKTNISYCATIAHCLINFNNAIFPTDLSLPLLLSLIHFDT